MQELISSIVRLSAAATLYSMQQMQTSVKGFDSKEQLESLRAVIDNMAQALTDKLDESKRSTVDNISNTSSQVVDRTMHALHVENLSLNPRELAHNATDLVRKTGDTLTQFVRPAKAAEAQPSEPQAAEEALASSAA